MTFVKAAEYILKNSGREMRSFELLHGIISENLVESRGKTPLQTLVAELNRQYDRATKAGTEPRIKKHKVSTRLVFWYI